VEAALIRPLFRLLCWLAAEHRGLLLDASPVARDRFVNRDTAPESPGAPESPEVPGEDLFAMVRSLGLDYGQLGAAELGAAYTALLDGRERKATGSYYTPPELVERLLDSALEPVLDQTQDRPGALLAVTVCDPACGAGHFLVAAARRIARRLPRPGALRDVIRHCIYGVDVNPVAVELTKIALWLEAAEPGQPFGCLEARIRHGNSLIGAISGTPATGTREAADAWCATLVQPQESRPFFHWPLEFPGVFRAGGFSCVVGNPPWERIKLSRRPEGESRFLRGSGRYPLTARGDLNA
jgi:hypothetical protein